MCSSLVQGGCGVCDLSGASMDGWCGMAGIKPQTPNPSTKPKPQTQIPNPNPKPRTLNPQTCTDNRFMMAGGQWSINATDPAKNEQPLASVYALQYAPFTSIYSPTLATFTTKLPHHSTTFQSQLTAHPPLTSQPNPGLISLQIHRYSRPRKPHTRQRNPRLLRPRWNEPCCYCLGHYFFPDVGRQHVRCILLLLAERAAVPAPAHCVALRGGVFPARCGAWWWWWWWWWWW